eukprot:CAMPEP_0175048842 /NCGR_PEP_ID=MMETSP0052_2-20121109/6417_1 /TAXON_ID=51329 ORGANISM="Polytomella parva, Strain SAG 63-3" /NCGR_SAMPLE_ID=MMETSP0052_2 /ASSEMBLY_ACC=CAM_ASM_000194 /LENGTH=755 /DNA_ID=CAMNT_0016312957 /DNA_START=367 /DNA_END=2634 /DNA_ORIENTATION=-
MFPYILVSAYSPSVTSISPVIASGSRIYGSSNSYTSSYGMLNPSLGPVTANAVNSAQLGFNNTLSALVTSEVVVESLVTLVNDFVTGLGTLMSTSHTPDVSSTNSSYCSCICPDPSASYCDSFSNTILGCSCTMNQNPNYTPFASPPPVYSYSSNYYYYQNTAVCECYEDIPCTCTKVCTGTCATYFNQNGTMDMCTSSVSLPNVINRAIATTFLAGYSLTNQSVSAIVNRTIGTCFSDAGLALSKYSYANANRLYFSNYLQSFLNPHSWNLASTLFSNTTGSATRLGQFVLGSKIAAYAPTLGATMQNIASSTKNYASALGLTVNPLGRVDVLSLVRGQSVSISSISSTLNITVTTANISGIIRVAGIAANCASNYTSSNFYNMSSGTSSSSGYFNVPALDGGLIASSNCVDALTTATVLKMKILTPSSASAFVVDPMSYFASYYTSVYQRYDNVEFASNSTFADAFKILNITIGGGGNSVNTSGFNFISQNWPASHPLSIYTYAANQLVYVTPYLANVLFRIMNVMGTYGENDVSEAVFDSIINNYLAGASTSTLFSNANIGAYITGVYGELQIVGNLRRSRRLQSVDPALIADAITSVANAISSSNALIVALINNLNSAIGSGATINAYDYLYSIAQVAFVQQNSLATQVSALAAAVASGNATLVNSLASNITSSYTGNALASLVNSVTVDMSSSGVDVVIPKKKKSHVAVGVGVGVGVGVPVVGGLIGFFVYKMMLKNKMSIAPKASSAPV